MYNDSRARRETILCPAFSFFMNTLRIECSITRAVYQLPPPSPSPIPSPTLHFIPQVCPALLDKEDP